MEEETTNKNKYHHQIKYIKERKETDPEFKKKTHLFIINYKKNRYNTDETYKDKVREYAKIKMREYRALKKEQQNK